jgi:hypothetical protein
MQGEDFISGYDPAVALNHQDISHGPAFQSYLHFVSLMS